MEPRTIDHNYDHQMARAIQQLLSDFDKVIENFLPDGLMDFVHEHREEFGNIIITHMVEWQSEEEWHEGVAG